MKKSRGRPKIWSDTSKLDEILELFPKDGSSIQAKELKEKALNQGISPNTLFYYRRKLTDNLQIVKWVDVQAKRSKFYYKRITDEELFGLKEFWTKNVPLIMQTWEKDPIEITGPIKKITLEKAMVLFLTYLFKTGEKARTIEDPQKRKEFIDIMLHIHLHPSLLIFSSLLAIESKHWGEALKTIQEMWQTTDKKLSDEIKRNLPEELSTLLLDSNKAFREGRLDEFKKKSKEFKKLKKSMDKRVKK